jgi:hypothetical protein
VLVAMLLPAVLYVWLLRGSFTSHPGLTAKLIQDWIFSRVTLMSLEAGLAGAIGIFSAAYARSEAWGSDYTAATGPVRRDLLRVRRSGHRSYGGSSVT